MINGPQDKPMAELSKPVYEQLIKAILDRDFYEVKKIDLANGDINLNFYVIEENKSPRYISILPEDSSVPQYVNGVFVGRIEYTHKPFLSFMINKIEDQEFWKAVISNPTINFSLTDTSKNTLFDVAMSNYQIFILDFIIKASKMDLNDIFIQGRGLEQAHQPAGMFRVPLIYYAILILNSNIIEVFVNNDIELNLLVGDRTPLDWFFSCIDVYREFAVDMNRCKNLVNVFLKERILNNVCLAFQSGAFFSYYSRDDAHQIVERFQDGIQRHIDIVHAQRQIDYTDAALIESYEEALQYLNKIKRQLTPPKVTKSALTFSKGSYSVHGASSSSSELTQSDATLTESSPTGVSTTSPRKAFQ